jgi:hypothetical protein
LLCADVFLTDHNFSSAGQVVIQPISAFNERHGYSPRPINPTAKQSLAPALEQRRAKEVGVGNGPQYPYRVSLRRLAFGGLLADRADGHSLAASRRLFSHYLSRLDEDNPIIHRFHKCSILSIMVADLRVRKIGC